MCRRIPRAGIEPATVSQKSARVAHASAQLREHFVTMPLHEKGRHIGRPLHVEDRETPPHALLSVARSNTPFSQLVQAAILASASTRACTGAPCSMAGSSGCAPRAALIPLDRFESEALEHRCASMSL